MRPGWRQPSRPRAPTSRGYQRALHQFTVEEITEALARFTLPGGIRPPWFALGLALPSELRRMLRARGRDAYPEFVKLLPSPPPQMPIQRWSARRVGLWAAILALVVVATVNSRYVLSTEDMVETPLAVKDIGCGDLEPLWLMAQSVPTASLVPCLQLLPVGWSVAEVAVNNGRSLITLNHDRGGKAALVVELTVACDPTVATEVTSEPPGARRSVRIDPTAPGFSATRAYDVPGGCVTQRFSAAAPKALRMSDTAATELGFITRQELNLEMGTALQRAAAAGSPASIMSQPGMQPRWASLEDLTPLAAAVWNGPPTPCVDGGHPGAVVWAGHGHDPVGHHDAHHRAHRRAGHRSWPDRQHARVPGLLAVPGAGGASPVARRRL